MRSATKAVVRAVAADIAIILLATFVVGGSALGAGLYGMHVVYPTLLRSDATLLGEVAAAVVATAIAGFTWAFLMRLLYGFFVTKDQ